MPDARARGVAKATARDWSMDSIDFTVALWSGLWHRRTRDACAAKKVVNLIGRSSNFKMPGWHEFYDFPFSWECHDPNWLIFFRWGRAQPPTRALANFLAKTWIPLREKVQTSSQDVPVHAARGYWEKEDRSHAGRLTRRLSHQGLVNVTHGLFHITWKKYLLEMTSPIFDVKKWDIYQPLGPWGLRFSGESVPWTYRCCPGLSLWLMPKNQATWKLQQLKIRPRGTQKLPFPFPWIWGSRGSDEDAG